MEKKCYNSGMAHLNDSLSYLGAHDDLSNLGRWVSRSPSQVRSLTYISNNLHKVCYISGSNQKKTLASHSTVCTMDQIS